MLINEFSTFFLNYRHFLLVFKQHQGTLYKLNALMFFFAFFISRIMFNSVVAYYVGRAFYLTTREVGVFGVPLWQFCLGIYLIVLFVIFYILNLYWFVGIVKHVKRSFATESTNGAEIEPLNKREEDKKVVGYETMGTSKGLKKREGGMKGGDSGPGDRE